MNIAEHAKKTFYYLNLQELSLIQRIKYENTIPAKLVAKTAKLLPKSAEINQNALWWFGDESPLCDVL